MDTREMDRKARRLSRYFWALTHRVNQVRAGCCGESCDLTGQEIKTVEFLGRNGPHKMKDLAEHLGLAVSTTTALVDKLESKQVVQRTRNTRDRRVVMVSLTGNGDRDYRRTLKAYMDFCRQVLQSIDPDDQDRLLNLLERIDDLP